jgi:chromosome segregation ATPase
MLVVAAMSLGWSISYYSRSDRIDTLEKQLASYTQADKLDLSGTVKEIEHTNNVVQANLSEIRAHFQWRDEKKRLEERILRLNGQLSELTAQVEQMHKELGEANDIIGQLENTIHKKQQEIDSFYPVNEEFWLDENTTRGIAGFDGILGLTGVSSDSVEVTYGNEVHRLHAGNYL